MSKAVNWPEWLTAIGTLAAVLVALFAETFWRWWRRPVLKATVRKDDAGCYYKTTVSDGNFVVEAYYFRLWITNKGRGPADEVQVFASKLSRRDASGAFEPVRQFLPMGLLWTHSQPASITLPRLHSDMGHHCELGRVLKPAVQMFALSVEVAPFTGWHQLTAGVYWLTLRLACANGSPRTQTVEIHYDGRWHDDEASMFRDGVVCTVLD